MALCILVVDDSSIVRKTILRTLGLTGIEIDEILEAENGQEALDVLGKKKVDLVFLDINMPVMNGVEFMENLSKDEILSQIPVVVFSTEGSRERLDYLQKLGVKQNLRKPTPPEILARTIHDVLGVSK